MVMLQREKYLDADLNDKRLTQRFNLIVNNLSDNMSGTIPQAAQSKGATKATYRFFDNKKVTPYKLLQSHVAQFDLPVSSRTKPRYLVLSDSTELDYTRKKGAASLGPLTYKKRRGLIVHNSLLVNDIGACVGLLKQDYIIRKDEDFGKSKERKNAPIEEKESNKWLRHFSTADQFCRTAKVELVYVADREADMLELFNYTRAGDMHLVIRSQHNRCLDKESAKLYEHLAQQPLEDIYTIPVVDAKTGKSRIATIAVRFCSTRIRLSKTTNSRSKKHLKPANITAVEAYEINPPEEVKPVRWVLLTTLKVEDFLSALQVIRYYVLRWLVERFHFLLKSGGAKIEELQLEKPTRLCNAIVTYSISVMKVMKLRYIAENEPTKSIYEVGITPQQCDILYSYVKIKIDKKIFFDPENPPTVWEFCRILGKVGGFIPSKRQPLPGLKILTRSMQKYSIILETHDAYFSKNDQKDVGYQ